jgi:hypothetical protein
MKGLILFLLFCIVFYSGMAQVSFRTIAPQQPVLAGESFEVQYILEGGDNIESFTAPAFTGFRFVTGPHIYKGSLIDRNLARPLINTVYTLASLKPGRYIIHGAKAMVNGSEINSNDVFVEVISKEEAHKLNKTKDGSFYTNSEYFLRPGEDPIEKIRQNLFLKVIVSKKSCFVGEPVVATYKLYSRLESKSDIVKNPGFYGFAVLDMINLADKAQAIETIRGKTFDVHTVRKVQLYPLQAGQFTIDPMELSNKVEFSRSEVNKKTEQEIVEGILNNSGDIELHNNTEVYENSVKTAPIPVIVKPLPAKNKTDSFTAAVGNFRIKVQLEKNELSRNESSHLIICITGHGNFTQINAPVIKWPAAIDVSEPVIKDSIDRLQVPLTGSKTFSYAFVSGKAGAYEIPALEFSFFNPDTNHFEKLATMPLKLIVTTKEKEKDKIIETRNKTRVLTINYWWLGLFLLVMLFILGTLLWMNARNKNKAEKKMAEESLPVQPPISVDSLLATPQMMAAMDDKRFYKELYNSIWEYFRKKITISGIGISKPALIAILKNSGIESTIIIDLITVLQDCETILYTDAMPGEPKEQLINRTRALLKTIDDRLK